jgi:hypothetical protein
LTAILAGCPPPPAAPPAGCRWRAWRWDGAAGEFGEAQLPPLRVLRVRDTLAGHHRPARVQWCLDHGLLPRSTPIAGSWLHLAESVQRSIVRRARAGQHPQTAPPLLLWLAQAVRGWHAGPTPCAWGGQRAARRPRAGQRRHALGGAGACTRRPVRRPQPAALAPTIGDVHAK